MNRFKRRRLERENVDAILRTAEWKQGTGFYIVPGDPVQNLVFIRKGEEPPNDLLGLDNWPHRLNRPISGTKEWWDAVEGKLTEYAERRGAFGTDTKARRGYVRSLLKAAYADLERDLGWQREDAQD